MKQLDIAVQGKKSEMNRYIYCPAWASNNKVIIVLSFLALCFFASTVALSVQVSGDKCNENGRNTIESEQARGNTTPKHDKKNLNYRLPRHILPTNYKLQLRPNVTNKTFEGFVEIALDINSPTKDVTLHANKLTITSASMINEFDDIITISSETSGDQRNLLIFKAQDEIANGRYTLKINFTGVLEGIVGLYGSSLRNGGTMVASKFQPTYARQAFPCFDEPDFKATYDITLIKPQNYVALSNMNEISKTLESETATEAVTFATSVPMSTYLACFVICDFDFKETEIESKGIGANFKLRSFAQKDQTHKIDFAQDIGKRATEFYINYYDVPFPLPKLDMIAIPDYVSGATEHWGLITYRETSFLVDESTASAQNKIAVANTIAHELAHMWFGNLVTMKWWDEVWLNEGFASYMQVKCLNAIEPSWTMLDQFLVKTMHSVLVRDATLSSHPIVQTVDTPDQITAIFDAISYNKGSSILRMLEGFIGEENFRKGISDYLKKHKYGNTVTRDLLASLEPHFKKEKADLSLTYILDTWTKQMGYPLVTVTKDAKSYQITQTRFLLDPTAVSPKDSEFNYRWFIPITYKTNKGVNDKVLWFSDKTNSVKIAENDVNWLKINNNQVGYYRVNYPADMWQSLIGQLKAKSDQLTISDRSHLLDDVFALAEAGVVPYELALDLTTYLTVEEDYVPWVTAASILNTLSGKLLHSLAHDKLQRYIQHLVTPIYQKQSWDVSNLGVIDRLLRTSVLSLATRAELPAAKEQVRSMFLAWLDSHDTAQVKSVETDLRSLVYYYGMKNASMSEWDKLWQIYKKEEDAQEQSKLRHALAAPRDAILLRKYLLLACDESNVRSQDYLTVLQTISANPSGAALVWDEVRGRWEELVTRFTLNSRYLGSMVYAVTSAFNTEAKLKEMELFFERYPDAGAGEASRRLALETVRNNIAWSSAHAPQVAAWLDARPDALRA